MEIIWVKGEINMNDLIFLEISDKTLKSPGEISVY